MGCLPGIRVMSLYIDITLLGRITYPLPAGTFDDLPKFPDKVGYVFSFPGEPF